jgi:lipoic acid synthetase
MRVRWLGRVHYREAWALQRAISRRSADEYLLLLEHPSVFTLGRNGNPDHVLVDPAAVGAELVRVDRGGDVTFHGPGQLIGYPLVTVGPGPHQGRAHVHRVEQVVIEALVSLGLDRSAVGRLEGFPGVWVGLDEDPEAGAPGPRKIAAIGVRTSRGRTTHGFALNVTPDLSMFANIVPCGIADRPVTSLRAEGFASTMSQVREEVIAAAEAVWGAAGDIQHVTDSAATAPGPAATPAGTTTATVTVTAGSPPDPAGPGSVVDRRTGPEPVAVAFGRHADASPLQRRLLRSGVDPAAGVPLDQRKPPWLRVPATIGGEYLGLRQGLRDLELVTVCEEAGCPNIYECWADGTATFMINGSRCTRACGFCQVDTRHPLPLDPGEPDRVAEAVRRMGLAHAVITCVARDDLADGGAGGFAAAIAAIRNRSPRTSVEVLISDCKGHEGSLGTIFDARPDVLNHNIETVARLQRAVRPSAGYARSLGVLARAKDAGLTTKSGIILGMGERESEVLATLADLRAVGVDTVTVGQYLRPSRRHLPVARFWSPEEFEAIRRAAMTMGFAHVQASPLTRSSYHAREAAEASVPTGSPSLDIGPTGGRQPGASAVISATAAPSAPATSAAAGG